MPRHIFVDKKTTYQRWSEAGYIDPNAFYYIKDSSEIITHGQLFGGDPSKFVLITDERLTNKRANPYALTIKKEGSQDISYDGSDTAEIVIPVTLPASDVFEWAKAETKPEYTYEEVGAAPAEHYHEQYLTKLTPDGEGNAITNFKRGETGEYIFEYGATYLVHEDLEPYALIDSPEFTGSPKAPTVAIDNTKSIATNEAVKDYVENKHYITANDTTAAAKKLANMINIALSKQVSGTTTFDGSQNVTIEVDLKYIPITRVIPLNDFYETGLYSGSGNLLNVPMSFAAGTLWELKVSRLNSTESIWGVKQELTQGDAEFYRVGFFNSGSNTVDWNEWIKRITSEDSISGNADNVTGIVTVEHGGTGLSSIPKDYMLIGAASGVVIIKATNQPEQNTVVLRDSDGSISANTFVGALNGNAASATKATQDASGNVITDTYEKKTDSFWLGNTEIPLNGAKGPITLQGVSFEGQGQASTDSEGNIISETYVRKSDTFFIGTTSISQTSKSGDITSLDIDITGNATTSTTADQAKKLNHMVELKFLGAVTGSVNTDFSLNKYEVTLAVNHNHDSSYVKKSGDTMTGYLKIPSYLEFTDPSVHPYILAKSSATQYWRIIGYNTGALDLGVTGSSTEIYATQFSDQFATVAHRVKLLDNLGNTQFPGIVTASKFVGEIEAKVDEAVKADKDSNDETIHETYQRKDSSIYIGRTAVPLARVAGELNLDGVNILGSSTNCTGNAATVTNGVYTIGNNTLTGNYTFNNAPKLLNGLIIPLDADEVKGINFIDSNDSSVNKAFIGFSDETQDCIILGWSANPTTTLSSLKVGESIFSYKGYNVYHAGNANLNSVDWTARNLSVSTASVSGQLAAGDLVSAGNEWDLLTLIQTDLNSKASGIIFADGTKNVYSPVVGIGIDEDGYFHITKDGGALSQNGTMMMKVSPAGVVTAAGGFVGDLVGNADTANQADKLAKKITLTLTGDVSGSAEFDGSEENGISLNTTVANLWSFLTDGTGNAIAGVDVNQNTKTLTFTYGTYLISTDLEGYALIENVPTKTSDLDNDAGFLVQGNLADYAQLSDLPTKTSELTNDSNFVVEDQLDAYLLIDDLPSNLSDFTDDLNVVKRSQALTSGYLVVASGTDTIMNGYTVQTGITQLDTAIPTSKAVATYVGNALTSAMTMKGTVGVNGTISALPSLGVKVGDSYRVITAGNYGGQKCEVGDIIFAIAATPEWHVIQNNVDVFVPSNGVNNGSVGLVPAPKSNEVGYLLTSNGEWKNPADISIGTASNAERLGGQLPSYYAVAHDHPYLADTTLYAGSDSVGGAALSAIKFSEAKTIKIGNATKTWDASGELKITLSELGAQPAGNYATSSHDHDSVYLKLSEAATQTITSTQSSLGNGILKFHIASTSYSMLGFSNDNGSGVEQLLGLIGFSSSGIPIIRINNNDYNILHTNNTSISDADNVVTIKINGVSKEVSGTGHSHSYNDLSDLPTLGSMSAKDVEDYEVSDGGATWGSKLTVKIHGVSKSLTIPANPNTDNAVDVSKTNPTSGTWYYPVWFTSQSGNGGVNVNDGFRYYSLEGTTSAAGRSIIQVGNSTQTGTAGNKYGELWLYAQKQGYARLIASSSLTAETTFTFGTGGTILTSGNSEVADGAVKINGVTKNFQQPNAKITRDGEARSWYNIQQYNSSGANPSYYVADSAIINIKSYAGWQPWIRAVASDNASWAIGQYTDKVYIIRIAKENTENKTTQSWQFNADGSLTADKFIGALQGNADTATTASKLTTNDTGSNTKFIYLAKGVAKASNASKGSGVKLMYLSSGEFTESSDSVASDKKLMYLSSGTLTVSSANVGSATKTVYLSGGEIKEGSDLDDWLKRSGGTMNGDITFANTGNEAHVARGIYGTVGTNDYWTIRGSQTASNGGYLELATFDDKNEPIYVRQYSGGTSKTNGTDARTLTLLDASGNTSMPGNLSVAGTLSITGTSTLTGNTEVKGTFKAVGATTLSDTLEVTKTATFKDVMRITKEQDVGVSYSGSLIIGPDKGENIGIDGNEIMARTYSNNAYAVATLYLNNEGGLVQVGGGGLASSGKVTASSQVTAGTYMTAGTYLTTGTYLTVGTNLTVKGASYFGTNGQKLVIDSNGCAYPYSGSVRTAGMYGVYDSHYLGHIWSMGTGYKISDDGKNPNSLYGLAYFHTNWSNDTTYNTTAGSKTAKGTYAGGHQFGWFVNGVIKAAIGESYIWSKGGFLKDGSNDNYVLLGGSGHYARTSMASWSSAVTNKDWAYKATLNGTTKSVLLESYDDWEVID